MDIIIDTKGQADLITKDQLIESEEENDITENEIEDPVKNLFKINLEDLLIEPKKEKEKKKISSSNDFCLEEFEREMKWNDPKKKKKHLRREDMNVSHMIEEVRPLNEMLKKSAITPGFEQLESVPPYEVSKRKLKKLKQAEREKTKGKQWFNMPAPEITDEIRHDLEVIQMRSVLDPKHFYKKNDIKDIPKYFQIGKVVDSPLDYYSERLTKKERKKTIVDELMADAEFSKYNKRKYKEIIEEKNKLHYKAHRHSKKLKRRK